jgi:hypothetical protein
MPWMRAQRRPRAPIADRLVRNAMIDTNDTADSTAAKLRNDPIDSTENADPIEPIEPIDPTDPTLPTDSTDPELPTDNTELRERMLSSDPLDVRRFGMSSE